MATTTRLMRALVVQRLQRHHHLDGGAVRVGDDVAGPELAQVRAGSPPAPPAGRRGPCGTGWCCRSPRSRRRRRAARARRRPRRRGENRPMSQPWKSNVSRFFTLSTVFSPKRHFRARRPAGGDRGHLIDREVAFGQRLEHFAPDRPCGADDRDPVAHLRHSCCEKAGTYPRSKWRCKGRAMHRRSTSQQLAGLSGQGCARAVAAAAQSARPFPGSNRRPPAFGWRAVRLDLLHRSTLGGPPHDPHRQDRAGYRLHQRHRPGHRPRAGRAGRQPRCSTASAIRPRSRRCAPPWPRPQGSASPISAGRHEPGRRRSPPWSREAARTARRVGHPGEQCRHPARRADRGVSRRERGTPSSPSTCPRRSTPSKAAHPGHAAQGLGAHHQHRLGARPGRQRRRRRPMSRPSTAWSA